MVQIRKSLKDIHRKIDKTADFEIQIFLRRIDKMDGNIFGCPTLENGLNFILFHIFFRKKAWHEDDLDDFFFQLINEGLLLHHLRFKIKP